MNLRQIRENAIAQAVAPLQSEYLANINENFVDNMINKGYHVIERSALWKFSEAESDITASANTRVCPDTPSDLGVPLAVWSDRLKCELSYHDDRQRFYPLEDKGEVRAYSMWGGELRFYPLPTKDEDFTLRYYKTWTSLSSDTDEPIFPETWHDLLLDYATYWIILRIPPEGDRFLPDSRANPYFQQFQARLQEMMNSDLVLPTWDAVPNYGFQEHVLGLEGEAW